MTDTAIALLSFGICWFGLYIVVGIGMAIKWTIKGEWR